LDHIVRVQCVSSVCSQRVAGHATHHTSDW
jgi:hypothetical protein